MSPGPKTPLDAGASAFAPKSLVGNGSKAAVSTPTTEKKPATPVPEKQKRAWNYVVIPHGNDGIANMDSGAPEQILWTYNELSAREAAASTAPPEPDHTLTLLEEHLAPFKKGVTTPNDDEFASAVPQLHRKGERAYHVKAFRGSKEGYLFFLPTGILWGFKKPLLFMPLNRIAAVSYTSILQRTFNMVVEVFTHEGGDPEATEELEFAMIDQEDYGGINEDYVMRKRLQDRSMADQRKAKLELAENAKAANQGADGDADVKAEDEGLTEMEKAAKLEQQLQDEEDEDEEDYDPGSDDESDGSGGTSSDNDDDDEEEDGDGEDDDDDMDEGGGDDKTKA